MENISKYLTSNNKAMQELLSSDCTKVDDGYGCDGVYRSHLKTFNKGSRVLIYSPENKLFKVQQIEFSHGVTNWSGNTSPRDWWVQYTLDPSATVEDPTDDPKWITAYSFSSWSHKNGRRLVDVDFEALYVRTVNVNTYQSTYYQSTIFRLHGEMLGYVSLHLIEDGGVYKTYKNKEWETVSTTYPTFEQFEEFGMVDLSILDRDAETMYSPLDDLGERFNVVSCVSKGFFSRLDANVIPYVDYKYKVEVTEPYQEIIDEKKGLTGDTSHEVQISNTFFKTGGRHKLYITVEDDLGNKDREFVFLTLFNRPPQINVRMEGLQLYADIQDLEGDTYRYKIILNGEVIYPLDGNFTDFVSGVTTFDRLFFSNELIIGEENVIEVIAEDFYGSSSVSTYRFEPEYMGLMFADMNGEFYSTDMGEIIKYLVTEPMMAGTSSLIYPVKLINKYPFKVNNIILWKDELELQDITVQLSRAEAPFIDEGVLEYGDLELGYDDYIIFYVRVVSRPAAMYGGAFDIFVKADPVSQ